MAPRTLVDLFTDNAERFASQTIIRYKSKKGGDYVDLSWAELKEMSFALAAGLADSGLGPGDRAAILSFNRLEWIAAEMGIMLAGGVSVAIYHTNTPEQCAHVLGDSGSRFVFVEDEEQLAKISGLDLPALEKIVLIQGTPPAGDDRVISYGDLLGTGRGRAPALADDGEIMLKGNNFLGYYNQPELTAAIMRHGWVYTGDVGRFDEDGFLIITDRKKDLIITSGGKNISPQNIENALARIPLVAVPFVYGDNRKYLTALITLDRAETEKWAADNGLTYASYGELTQGPQIREHVQAGLDQVNAALPRYETIKRFIILEREFSQDEGEITPTLKVKRKPIVDKFGPRLDAFYQ